MYAVVTECKGRWYIGPLNVGINGMSWPSQREAEYVADAINRAYEKGARDLRTSVRELLFEPTE